MRRSPFCSKPGPRWMAATREGTGPYTGRVSVTTLRASGPAQRCVEAVGGVSGCRQLLAISAGTLLNCVYHLGCKATTCYGFVSELGHTTCGDFLGEIMISLITHHGATNILIGIFEEANIFTISSIFPACHQPCHPAMPRILLEAGHDPFMLAGPGASPWATACSTGSIRAAKELLYRVKGLELRLGWEKMRWGWLEG